MVKRLISGHFDIYGVCDMDQTNTIHFTHVVKVRHRWTESSLLGRDCRAKSSQNPDIAKKGRGGGLTHDTTIFLGFP